MKNIIKLSLLMVVSLLALAACDTTNSITQPEMKANVNPVDKIYMMAPVSDQGEIKSGILNGSNEFPLWDVRNVNAGEVYVSNDGANLYITYYMHDDWQIKESSLNASLSPQAIPVDPNGIPQPNQFGYQVSMNRGKSLYTQRIPLAELGIRFGEYVYIASHAEVIPNKDFGKNSEGQLEEQLGEGGANPEWWWFGKYRVRLNFSGQENAPRVREPFDLSGAFES